ncbi:MAG: methyltransferase domain-containing protein [Deltaproteobacteria bacterium]|nr:methyltransferase domain-containing protein [Deltaproteobacteria bacterium]
MSVIKTVRDFSLKESAKNDIRLAFSNAAKNYDTHALFQKEMAKELLNGFVLPVTTHHSPFTTILDIGCGTGFLTHGLSEIFPKANIFGCDIAHEMTGQATCKVKSAKSKKTYFLTADGGVLPYKNKAFDMVASNLAYQWIHDAKTAFSEAHRVLRPGGIFIFSTLGGETLKELRHCYAEASAKFNKDGLPPFMAFSEKQAVQSALEGAGFKNIFIETTKMIKTYPDMWTLLKTIKSIGAGNPFKDGDKSLGRGFLLKKMAEVYKERFQIQDSRFKSCSLHLATCKCIYATYEAMFVRALKL